MVWYVHDLPDWFGLKNGAPGYFSCLWGQFLYNKYPPRAPVWKYNKYHTKCVSVRWRSLYENIVQDWVLIVIDIFFSDIFLAIFHPLSNGCPQRILCGELALRINIHFEYPILLFYLLYQTFLKWAPENYPPPVTIWPHLDVLIGRDFSWCPPKFQFQFV